MILTITSGADSVAQFLTVVIIFLFVLVLTFFTTKWIANYQKGQASNGNVEIIEVSRLTANKYIEIVRCGDKYLAIAVCKDTVTVLCELSKEEISLKEQGNSGKGGFRELLDRAKNVDILEKDKEPEK